MQYILVDTNQGVYFEKYLIIGILALAACAVVYFAFYNKKDKKSEKNQDTKLFETIKFYQENKGIAKKIAKEANKLVDEGNVLLKAGHDAKANACYQKAISKAKSVHGETSGLSSLIYVGIIGGYAKAGKFKEALVYEDKSLPILKDSMASKLKIFLYLNNLSHALFFASECRDYPSPIQLDTLLVRPCFGDQNLDFLLRLLLHIHIPRTFRHLLQDTLFYTLPKI